MKRAANKFFLVLISVCFAAINAFSQDWTQWMGKDRKAVLSGYNAPSAWPEELKQGWKVNVGSGDGTPLLAGDRLYLNTRQGSEEVIMCLDAASGKELWKTVYPCIAVTGPSGSHPGPRSTPSLSEGKLITFGVSGILTCSDANTGKVLWRRYNPDNTVPLFFTGMSPLITGNKCIAHVGAKDKGELLALDMASGKELWKIKGDGPSYASPALMTVNGKTLLVVQTEKNLQGFSLDDGRLLWQYATPVMQRFYNCSSPCINGETVYISGQGSGIKALKIAQNGDAYTVTELWSNTAVGTKWNTPVLKDGYLYGFSDQKRAFCVNATNGETAWIDANVSGDFSTLVDMGILLAGLPSTGWLMIIKPDPSAYNEVKRYKVAETPVYSFPVISGKGIYVKDSETLALFRVQ
ncbi:MAG: PQQ-like beta-propeller repeat protein [Bacteroidales bacterium]|jgi:outer membrane protein assembly factor BamB|nr:PQQ-like beta-propeller repeat protein [Bacteroidales bacterium]MCU0408135.1 PQQ-like beta-propeller repeat protein [Bacteroidales bacterium]